jgi:integrase
MPSKSRASRRPSGTGALILRVDSRGRETWYGKWRVAGSQVKRRLGPRRLPGSSLGLTAREAEAALRRAIGEMVVRVSVQERLDFGEVAGRYLLHVERVLQRKPTTIADYKSIVRRHLAPFFGGGSIERVGTDAVAAYIHAKLQQGLSVKTVSNHLNLAHAVFRYAVKRGWATANPVATVDRPRGRPGDPDVRFLTSEEVDLLLVAVPDDHLGPTDRALYLTAAYTGLRQGELAALRWRDIDWSAGVIRVRRNYTRGQFGTPKSRRSTRAVPMAKRVASELKGHLGGSGYTGDDDLVFGHPSTGQPYDASRMRKRFQGALVRAGVRLVRFHDLRHTFGTRMAAAGAPLRAIQEWMGHRNYTTTLIYADYAPDPAQGTAWAERAFGPSKPES